MLFILK